MRSPEEIASLINGTLEEKGGNHRAGRVAGHEFRRVATAELRHRVPAGVTPTKADMAELRSIFRQARDDLMAAALAPYDLAGRVEDAKTFDTDPLTKAATRAAGIDWLEKTVLWGQDTDRQVAVICADVRAVSKTNHQFGSDAGDALLVAVAEYMKVLTRDPADKVIRLGGDEFAVVLMDVTEAEAKELAEWLQGTYKALNNGNSLAIGVASLQDGDTADSLLKNADQASAYHKEQQGDRRARKPPRSKSSVSESTLEAVASSNHRFFADELDEWVAAAERLSDEVEKLATSATIESWVEINGHLNEVEMLRMRADQSEFSIRAGVPEVAREISPARVVIDPVIDELRRGPGFVRAQEFLASHSSVMVAVARVEGLEEINNVSTLGHFVADPMLKRFTSSVTTRLDGDSLVFRLAGGKIAIAWAGDDALQRETLAQVQTEFANLERQVRSDAGWDDPSLPIGMTIGMSRWSEEMGFAKFDEVVAAAEAQIDRSRSAPETGHVRSAERSAEPLALS